MIKNFVLKIKLLLSSILVLRLFFRRAALLLLSFLYFYLSATPFQNSLLYKIEFNGALHRLVKMKVNGIEWARKCTNAVQSRYLRSDI